MSLKEQFYGFDGLLGLMCHNMTDFDKALILTEECTTKTHKYTGLQYAKPSYFYNLQNYSMFRYIMIFLSHRYPIFLLQCRLPDLGSDHRASDQHALWQRGAHHAVEGGGVQDEAGQDTPATCRSLWGKSNTQWTICRSDTWNLFFGESHVFSKFSWLEWF